MRTGKESEGGGGRGESEEPGRREDECVDLRATFFPPAIIKIDVPCN